MVTRALPSAAAPPDHAGAKPSATSPLDHVGVKPSAVMGAIGGRNNNAAREAADEVLAEVEGAAPSNAPPEHMRREERERGGRGAAEQVCAASMRCEYASMLCGAHSMST